MSTSSDLSQRFLLDATDIRGEIVTLDKSFQEACLLQNLCAQAIPLFGEFLAGATLIGSQLKREGIFTLQAQGDSAIRVLSAESNHKGHIRGIVRGDSLSALDNLSFREAIGKGTLFITHDPEQGQRYQGIIPLEHADLQTCLSAYFEHSEQVPTQLLLFANHERCGGLLVQCLPKAKIQDDEQRAELWSTVTQLCATLKADEFFETDHQTLLFRLFHEYGCKVFDEKPISFRCSCSKERSSNAISALGKEEANNLLEEQNPIQIQCHYCGTEYTFDESDLNQIFNSLH